MNEIKIFRGDDVYLNLTFKNEEGIAIDITSFKIYFTVKVKDTDDDNEAVLQVTNIDHDDAVNGISHKLYLGL